jgi:hypothetical protein
VGVNILAGMWDEVGGINIDAIGIGIGIGI